MTNLIGRVGLDKDEVVIMPKISVIMPVYNSEKYLRESIDSILNQTYTDFEFIIIDDGSTDNSKEIILSYNDSRIIYMENRQNSGIVVSLNKGLEAANGEYIARMDADDISERNRFQMQNDFLDEHNDIGVVGSAMIVFNENGDEKLFSYATTDKMAKADLIFNSSLGHPTVMIRKSCLGNLKYEAEYQGLEDFVLWWRIAQINKIVSLKEPLLHYRKHSGQITSHRSEKVKEQLDKFTEERIAVLLKNPSKDGVMAYKKYCNGELQSFSQNEVYIFIDFLSEMVKANKEKRVFGQHELKVNFEGAVSHILRTMRIKEPDRFNMYFYAWKNKVLSSARLFRNSIKFRRKP